MDSPLLRFNARYRAWFLRVLIAILGCAFLAGVWLWGRWSATIYLNSSPASRLGGYALINPLLSCNFSKIGVFPRDKTVESSIASVINTHEELGDISRASVYFAEFMTGRWAMVNGDQTYYPSSLGKVPIMMAYFTMAENSSTLLDKPVMYPVGSPDLNAAQEIQPPRAIVPGRIYTVRELIGYMIKYSDNNAAELLYELADQDSLLSVYNDLGIPFEERVTSSTVDFMKPQQYATLFRILYNATYLSHTFSEEALDILSQSSFTQGIVAGVPSSTVVAHKLGLVSFASDGVPYQHELHDCGIVYAPSHPYLLCVMTEGPADLSGMERTIADISRAAYSVAESRP